MLRCTPATPAEMATAGGEGCVWHISAVHWVFSLSGEGEDYKVCRFSNTCCAEMRLVLQGHANGGEIPRVLLCTWQQCQVPAWEDLRTMNLAIPGSVGLRLATLQCYRIWRRLCTTWKKSYIRDTWA